MELFNLSEEEKKTLKSISLAKRIEVMSDYLLGINGAIYNMKDLGVRHFGDENYSWYVSLITRAYNFQGKNGGRYRAGCAFERKYQYQVTKKDIEAFVKAYPNGSFNSGVEFEEFLLAKRVNQRGAGNSMVANRQSGNLQNNSAMQRQPSSAENNKGEPREDEVYPVMWTMFIILLLVCKLVFHFGWIVSIILAGIVASGITGFIFFGNSGE